jgi:hypothetical protein
MSALSIQPTYPIFTDIDGQPLEDGYVWIGTANLDPQTNPISVFFDAALTIPAAQPIRTLSGYPARAGSPGRLYVNSDYSIRVMNKNGTVVYSAPSATERYSGVVISTIDASQVTYTPPVGGVTTNVENKLARYISVLDFGADPTGATDSSAAFQAALDAAKGADGTGNNRSVFSLYVPSVEDGFYRIENTLTIDGTYGFTLFGDGSQTKRSNENATIRWFGPNGQPIINIRGQTGIPSNPNFLITIKDLTFNGFGSSNIPYTFGLPASYALAAIYIGPLVGAPDNTLLRTSKIENCVISNCRFGIYSGNPTGLNTDHALVTIDNCFIYGNTQAGIRWGTGNALAAVINCTVAENGWDNAQTNASDAYMGAIGANVILSSGYMDLYSYVGAGLDASKPKNADIYQDLGRISINNAWSDTHGYFFYQDSASTFAGGFNYQVAQIMGVRHWEGGMTVGNTPDSMRIVAPGTSIISCSVYGNIKLDSGILGRPICMGINFGRAGATFIGSGVDTQRSLIHHGNLANYAQSFYGGINAGQTPFNTGDSGPTHLLMKGRDPGVLEVADAAASGTNMVWLSRTDDADGSQVLWYTNCYYDNAAPGWRPLQNTKACWQIEFGGVSGFRILVADPNGSNNVLSFQDAGGFLSAPLAGSRNQITFQVPQRAADPTFTSGDFWEGSMYYNTATNKLRLNTGGSTWVDLN